MRILVDARLLGRAISGVERYLFELITELGNPNVRGNHRIDAYVSGTFDPRLQSDPAALPPTLNKRIENPAIAAVRAYDVFHRSFQPADFSTVIEIGAAPASVLSVHDLIGYRRREYWADEIAFEKYRQTLEYAVIAADRILAISNATKRDLISTLNVDESRIDVAHLGANLRFQPLKDRSRIDHVLAKYGLKPGYVLSIGTDYPHKNRIGLLKAFEMLREKFPDLSLVFAGPRKYGRPQPELDALFDKLRPAVVEIENVPDEDIVALYNGAGVYVFPSLDEGFGLPVLEAFGCEVPVVCSNSTSLPEPAGDAAILVDATKPAELRDAISSVISNDDLRTQLIARGHDRIRQFTWEKTARETIASYERAAAGRIEQARPLTLSIRSKEIPRNFSIVICTRNRSQKLKLLLQSIRQLEIESSSTFEVVIVDNASDDDTRLVAEGEAGQGLALVVVSEPVLGVSRARNRGIASAKGDVVIFIDDDVELPTDFLTQYAQAWQRWPDAAAIGGRVILKWVSPRPGWLDDGLSGLLGMTTSLEEHKCSGPKFDIIGCNMSFRREIFADVGGFNVALGYRGDNLAGNEEGDMLRRVERAGGTIVHSTCPWLYHLIERDKLNREYFLRRYYNQGVADAQLDLSYVPVSYSAIDSLRARALETRADLKWSAQRKLVSGRARFADLVWYRYVDGTLSRINSALESMKPVEPVDTPDVDPSRDKTRELIKDLSARLANSEAQLAEITGSGSRMWKVMRSYYRLRRKLSRKK